MSGSWRRNGHARRERLPRALEVAKPRLGERLLELDGALDRVLDRPVRRVERRDRVVLGAAQDRLHLADARLRAPRRPAGDAQ